jgi:putative membrane protein
MSTTDSTRQIGLLLLFALALLLVVPLLLGGFGSTMGGYGPMVGGHGPMTGGGAGDATAVPGWAVAVVFFLRLLGIAVLVAGGYLLYRAFARSSDGDEALAELRLAYARGDLTDEEYRERRETLRGEG